MRLRLTPAICPSRAEKGLVGLAGRDDGSRLNSAHRSRHPVEMKIVRLVTVGLGFTCAASLSLGACAITAAPRPAPCSQPRRALLALHTAVWRDKFADVVAIYGTEPGPHKVLYVDWDPHNSGFAVGLAWSAATVAEAESKAKMYCEEYRKQHHYIAGECVRFAVDGSLAEGNVFWDPCDGSSRRYQEELKSLAAGTSSLPRQTQSESAVPALEPKLLPGVHYSSRGRYVSTGNRGVTYELWVTNDGQVGLSCTASITGSVPDEVPIEAGGPVVYRVENTAVIDPGQTMVFPTMRATLPNSATSTLHCDPRR
jgi:hypothetical protein